MSRFALYRKSSTPRDLSRKANNLYPLREFGPGISRLALELLLIVAMMPFCFSCLPIYQLSLDESGNNPPVIIEDKLVPQPGPSPEPVLIRQGSAHTTFRAKVVDYDGDPEIFAKWILTAQNRNEDSAPIVRPVATQRIQPIADPEDDESRSIEIDEIFGANTNIGNAKVYETLSFELSSTAIIDDPERFAPPPKTHLLELFVADRPFKFDLLATEPRTEEGEPTQFAARAAWLLEFVDVR